MEDETTRSAAQGGMMPAGMAQRLLWSPIMQRYPSPFVDRRDGDPLQDHHAWGDYATAAENDSGVQAAAAAAAAERTRERSRSAVPHY